MKNLGILLTLILGLISCDGMNAFFQKNEYYDLPDSKRTQLHETDTLVFINENSIRDSFIVRNIIKGNWQIALGGTSGKEPYSYHEFEYIMINNIHDSFDNFRYNAMIAQSDGNYGEGAIPLDKSCDSLIIGIETGKGNLWNDNKDPSTNYLPSIKWYKQKGFVFSKAHSTMIINNISYADVQEFTSTSGIKKILYDYKSGIIEFLDSENHRWTKIK
jgi:hypothetical protein